MSEFKGTKSKKDWEYEYDGDGMRFNGISVYVDDCYEEYRADAQLISKAPEMLEILQEFVSDFDNGLIEDFQIARDRFEKLIKEATKL